MPKNGPFAGIPESFVLQGALFTTSIGHLCIAVSWHHHTNHPAAIVGAVGMEGTLAAEEPKASEIDSGSAFEVGTVYG